MLKEYKAEQDEQALKYGDKWVETDRLYTKWNGEPMQNGTPYFWLNEFCEKHRLPFYGIHSFRHLFASLKSGCGHCDGFGSVRTFLRRNNEQHLLPYASGSPGKGFGRSIKLTQLWQQKRAEGVVTSARNVVFQKQRTNKEQRAFPRKNKSLANGFIKPFARLETGDPYGN